MRLLLCDPLPERRDDLKDQIEILRHQLILCNHAADLPALVERESPDVVLLAAHLPDDDAAEICRQLKKRPDGGPPVIMIIDSGDHEAFAAGQSAGVDEFLSSPVEGQELIARLRRVSELSARLIRVSRLRIPRRDTAGDQECRAAVGTPDDKAVEGAGYTLLLVEDDVALSAITGKILRQYGYNVITASDGRAALEMAKRQTPDLILLDVLLPGLNGYEVCLRLKSGVATRPIPVILVTAIEPAKGAEEGFLVGADDYLAKPVNSAELRVRIRTMLRIQELRRPAPVIASTSETAKGGDIIAGDPEGPPEPVDWREFTRKLAELEEARTILKGIFHRHLEAHFQFWMMSGKSPEEKKAAFAAAMDWLATEVFNPEKVFHLKNGKNPGKQADAGAAECPVHYSDVIDNDFLTQLHADARLKLAGRLNLPMGLLGALVRREAVSREAWEELFPSSPISDASAGGKADPKACVAAPAEGFNLDDIRFAFFSQISILAGLTDSFMAEEDGIVVNKIAAPPPLGTDASQ